MKRVIFSLFMISFIIKVVFKILKLLSFRFSHRIGTLLGLVLYKIPTKIKKITATNIELCFPKLSSKQQQILVKETLIQSAKGLTELGPLWSLPFSKIKALAHTVTNLEALDLAAKSEQGVICLLPHIGSWEYCSLFFAENHPATALYRPSRQPALDKLIKKSRQRFGMHLVSISNSGIKSLYRALLQGKTIAVLPDQDPGKGKGIYTPFFGIECNTMPLIAKLIKKTKPAVIMIYALRSDNGRGYEVVLNRLDDALTKPLDTLSEIQILTHVNQAIEKVVRQYPSQYQWTYKRYKYQPDGKKLYNN